MHKIESVDYELLSKEDDDGRLQIGIIVEGLENSDNQRFWSVDEGNLIICNSSLEFVFKGFPGFALEAVTASGRVYLIDIETQTSYQCLPQE
ncbi:hypothetical protein ACI2KR_07905 [Pseudomonas luteola]